MRTLCARWVWRGVPRRVFLRRRLSRQRREVLRTTGGAPFSRTMMCESEVELPGACVVAAAAFTGGSVADGRDPLLAGAVWVAVLVDEAGTVTATVAEAAAGRQTAPQAELPGALRVAEGSAGSVPVAAESEYVRASARAPERPASVEAAGHLHGAGFGRI